LGKSDRDAFTGERVNVTGRIADQQDAARHTATRRLSQWPRTEDWSAFHTYTAKSIAKDREALKSFVE
jgi:hypothetical protein